MKIVVLAGGLSPERDVSLSSGTMACNALRQAGHRAILVDLFYGVETLPDPIDELFACGAPLPPMAVTQDAPDLAAVRASRAKGFSAAIGSNIIELCRAADICYLALHGDDGENGRMQAFFDLTGVRYTGSGFYGCAFAMHKWSGRQLMSAAGIRIPKGQLIKKGARPDLGVLPLPLVVKPCCGGSSIGVSIVRCETELDAALGLAFRYENEVVVEEYIKGREIACGILGGKALPLIEIIPHEGFYDYKNKYQPGLTTEITPARVDEETTRRIQRKAERAFRALQLDVYARLDFLLCDNGDAYCLEANTLPGLTPTSLIPQEAAAAGIDYQTLCCKIVELSLRKYGL